jgi:hypothetical protein
MRAEWDRYKNALESIQGVYMRHCPSEVIDADGDLTRAELQKRNAQMYKFVFDALSEEEKDAP